MLQTTQQQPFDGYQLDDDSGPAISPSYVLEVLRRRAIWFIIPFAIVLTIGVAVAALWPASYLSEGTILVVSPEIPSDLVRPTVSTHANERMQVIKQRIMTRDNLLAIAKKYHLSTGWRGFVSGTEIVDFIRNRTVIKPIDVSSRWRRNQHAIAFAVGFRYENPQIAMKVANEFVTLILKEDVRERNSYASATTKFMARDVERIEDQLSLLDGQILEIKQRIAQAGANPNGSDNQSDADKTLAALKAQLAVKSAVFSDKYPDIIALKRKIAALEKAGATAGALANSVATKTAVGAGAQSNAGTAKEGVASLGLDTLETKQKSLQDELTRANQKLAAARLGESLEQGQHAERLEVIEQPSLPDKPVSPHRKKLFAAAFAAALMAGGGLMIATEMADKSIRRSADVAFLLDRQLIVSIPYIATKRETQRKKKKIIFWLLLILAVIVVGVTLAYYYLPPPDILYAKVVNKLMGLLLK